MRRDPMKQILIAALAVSLGFATPAPDMPTPKEIRLLVAKKEPGTLIESRGHFRIYDAVQEEPIASASPGKRHWIEATPSGLRFGDEFINIRQIVFIPQDKKSTLLIDGIQYRGVLAVYAAEGKVFCVNEVDLEDYVTSVLSNKIDRRVQREALHALAVVERTRAAYLVEANPGKNWHAVAETVGYSGYGSTYKKIGIEEAARATRSFILHSKAPNAPVFGFDASWCMHSAGSLAPLSAVVSKVGFDSSIYTTSAFAKKDAPRTEWSYSFPKAALAQALKVDGIQSVEFICEPKTSKAHAVRIRDDENTLHEMDFIAFQNIFGQEFIQSNNLQVDEITKKTISLKGSGVGLGSGVCLYSAEQMALLDQDAKEILATFFPGARVEKIDTLAEEHKAEKSAPHVEV